MSTPNIRRRPQVAAAFEAARQSGYTELQAGIIAARLPHASGEVHHLVSPSLGALDNFESLPDIKVAATKIADAIQGGMRLICVADHDVDGGTAAAIVKSALCEFFKVPESNVLLITSHRMREGYGVSDALAERIIEANGGMPALIVTVDQGSTDELRIAKLLEAGIETVVTDHHEIPDEGIPKSAVAVVNPIRKDGFFPDTSIAGCYVAFLVMSAVRAELVARGYLPPDAPKLSPLLDMAACGTVADCVDMGASLNNRAVVRYGLRLMNAGARPCWRAMAKLVGRGEPFTAETISFSLAPRLNCSGRLDDSMLTVDFLLSKTDEEAERLLQELDAQNTRRREIQKSMTDAARPIALAQAQAGVPAIVIYLPDGHAGVHGICASRVVEAHGRPTVFFSPKQGEPGNLTGSLRSVEGVHIRDALLRTRELTDGQTPVSAGGHAMAAGCRIREEDLDLFTEAFRAAVAEQRAASTMAPLVETDGTLHRTPDLAALEEIAALEPYGRKFPAPVFEGAFEVVTVRPVGDGTHLKLQLAEPGTWATLGAIWFGARENAEAPAPVVAGQMVTFLYTLHSNTFRGVTNVDLHINAIKSEAKEIQG